MPKKLIQCILAIGLLSGFAQATSITYTLTFNTGAVTLFPAPLAGDSYSLSASQYFGHTFVAQDINTTENISQDTFNFTAGGDARGNVNSGINQNLLLIGLSGVTLANAGTQPLAFSINDTASGASHIFSVVDPLPFVKFQFTDGSSLTVTATAGPIVTLASGTQAFGQSVNYSVTYAAGTALPEPATLGLTACGLLGLVVAARRRRV